MRGMKFPARGHKPSSVGPHATKGGLLFNLTGIKWRFLKQCGCGPYTGGRGCENPETYLKQGPPWIKTLCNTWGWELGVYKGRSGCRM
jgi:hypothetical protein